MTYKEKGHPDLQLPLTDMTEAVARDAATLRLTFTGKQSARTILTVVDFPIVSKAYYDANAVRQLAAEAAARLRPLQGRPRRRRADDRI